MYGRATPNATSRRLDDWPCGDGGGERQRRAVGRAARGRRGHPGRRVDSVGPRVSRVEPARLPALLLVARHPDDETLGFGATAAALQSRGVDVHVVSVS